MGQSKPTAYNQIDTITPEQKKLLNDYLSQSGQNTQSAAEGYKQFLPGGSGNNAITAAANQNFQQVTQPGIINALGSNSKSSSALNQALAGGAANLNTNLGAIMAQNQLQAAQGLGSMGVQQGNIGLNREAVALEKSEPLWKKILLGAGKGAAGGSLLGPWGALAGGVIGGVSGAF